MFAGQNWFAYGFDRRWEIIAAENCDFVSDKVYDLSDFLRGQFGTEWATGLHQTGDRVVLLDSTALKFVSVNASQIGADNAFRGISYGGDINSDSSRAFTYHAVNLKPLSPCHVKGSINPANGDWEISWQRRSRFAGWNAYVDAQMGEASEQYLVAIVEDEPFSIIKRTLSSNQQSAVYTAAQQTADFGELQSSLTLSVSQCSEIVGAGYAASAVLPSP
jgi:hypothetical protein